MKKIAVNFQNITKEYILHHEKPTLTEKIFAPKEEKFNALNQINLTIYQGESIGIIGPNGCGKTTLLKIIASITIPTNGKLHVEGRVVPIIDLNSGFQSDLTGYENIYLNGLIMGMSRREIKRNLPQIIKFADLGQFVDAPLYTYSTGMKLRLGFAIAAHASPDILILDEGMAVGDEKFQKKAKEKILQYSRQGKTIIIVSHWLDYLQQNCKRIIILQKGRIAADGGTNLISKYEQNLF